MSDLIVPNTFVALTTASSSQVNSNFSEIVNYINNRDDGSSTWDNLNVTAIVGNPVTIKSNQSTTEVAIDNTATDGDPQITFKLSGAQKYVIGIDDSDSDFLKLATTGITTNVAMQVPTVGAQVQFNPGTALLPGISIIGDPDTGITSTGPDRLDFTVGGTVRLRTDNGGFVNIISSDLYLTATNKIYLDGGNDTYITEAASNRIDFVTGGSARLRLDNTGFISVLATDLYMTATNKIYLDGGDNTYILEGAADRIQMVTGGTTRFTLDNSGFLSFISVDVYVSSTKKLYLDGGNDTYISESAANIVDIAAGGAVAGQFDSSAVANNTRFLVYDVTGAALRRVTIGANDSGGAGFRVLRIPN